MNSKIKQWWNKGGRFTNGEFTIGFIVMLILAFLYGWFFIRGTL